MAASVLACPSVRSPGFFSTANLAPALGPAHLPASPGGTLGGRPGPRLGGSALRGRPGPRLGAGCAAAASRQHRLLTSSRASVTHFTAWKGSMTCSASGQNSLTTSATHRAPSLVTTSIPAQRSLPSSSKKDRRVSPSCPLAHQTTQPRSWSTTTVR